MTAGRTGDHVAGGPDPLTALAEIINQAGISGGNTHAVARAVQAAGWRYEPDTLNFAADALDAIAGKAMRDGREHAGLDAYSGVLQVVGWLRARADNYLPPVPFTKHLEQTGGLRTCGTCGLVLGDCRCPFVPDDPERLRTWAQRTSGVAGRG